MATEDSIRLGPGPTIFQAEIIAIAKLCDILLDQNIQISYFNRICTESKEAIHALSATIISSETVQRTLNKLKHLSHLSTLHLMWAPAHTVILGNGLADRLANTGANAPPIGPPPFAHYSKTYITNSISDSLHQELRHRLSTSRDPHIFNLRLILKSFDKYHYTLLSRSKTGIRTLTHIFTGWNYLKHCQHKIGNEPSNICDKCNFERETTEHYLTTCIADCTKRLATFRHAILNTETLIQNKTVSGIISYIRSTKYIYNFEPP